MSKATATRTPDEVLRAVADMFEMNPALWGREWYRNPSDGCRCPLGVITLVVDPDDTDGDPGRLPAEDGKRRLALDAVALLEAYLTDELGFSMPETDDEGRDLTEPLVGYWNDTPGRTVHEVVGTLRAAARWSLERAA